MSTFGLRVSNSPAAQKWADETAERLKGDSLVTNPFKGYLVRVDKKDDKLLLVVKMEPVYPGINMGRCDDIRNICYIWRDCLDVVAFCIIPSEVA